MAAHQAPPSLGFSRQEYWSGFPIQMELVSISFSNAWKWKVKVKSLSHVWLLATPWTAAHQAPPPVGFSRQEYWSGVQIWSTIRKLCFKGSQCGRLVWFILESSGSSWALKMTGVWICSGVGAWMWRVWVAVRWFPWKEEKKKKAWRFKVIAFNWPHLGPIISGSLCLGGSGHLSKPQVCAVPSHHMSFEHPLPPAWDSLPCPCHFPPTLFLFLLRNLFNLCPFLTNTFLIPTKKVKFPYCNLS